MMTKPQMVTESRVLLEPVAPGDMIFQIWVSAISGKNFGVCLVQHFFELHELDRQNVRGVGNKLPFYAKKMEKIKNLLYRYYLTIPSQKDILA